MTDIELLKNLSNAIRILSAQAIEKAKSGHPGMPLGMSDVVTVLMLKFLKFNPNDPTWLNRDRLVFSAGHGSMLLYAVLYLCGYKDFTLDDIKNFRQLNSKAAGHPERELHQAIETTTGPLGQGLANAVGMAIAKKKLQAHLGDDLVDYKIYCLVGDGCLMEGIAYEATSLAGHLKLNDLIVLFDDNSITIDGPTSLTISEDQSAKFTALGWHVISINGHDFAEIEQALTAAQFIKKPVIIACKTIIGYGAPTKSGSSAIHGSPLGALELAALRNNLDWLHNDFEIDAELLNHWHQAWSHNETSYLKWQDIYTQADSDIKNIYNGYNPDNINILSKMREIFANQTINEPTRSSSGRIIDLIADNQTIVIGSADLATSNNIKATANGVFDKQNFTGNFIHYGPREAAMAAIMNGLMLSGFKAIGGTFLVFSDYMRPAIRLAALMHLPVIYIFTHDSIGVGEDGPTHQPIEHLASLRAIPNLNVMRPADIIEVAECWELALKSTNTPTILALSRQTLPQIRTWQSSQSASNITELLNMSAFGAYYIDQISVESVSAKKVIIFATGSEVSTAFAVKQILSQYNIVAQIVSIPCFELFFAQTADYIDHILNQSVMLVAIEFASSYGWHKIIGQNGLFFGLDRFGTSGPLPDLLHHFELTAVQIADNIKLALYNIS